MAGFTSTRLRLIPLPKLSVTSLLMGLRFPSSFLPFASAPSSGPELVPRHPVVVNEGGGVRHRARGRVPGSRSRGLCTAACVDLANAVNGGRVDARERLGPDPPGPLIRVRYPH